MKHEAVMKKRTEQDRVVPKAVVECIKPALLAYICKHMIPIQYRTSSPEDVPALVIHRWVMAQTESSLETDNEAIKQIKAIKIDLAGENGVRNVQRAFIKLHDIRRKYRLKLMEKER